MPTTVRSLDDRSTRLPPSAPPAYLLNLLVTHLQRRGFESAEAGALVEMERLLERHVRNLFTTSLEYSSLASRRQPNAIDLLCAHASLSAHSSPPPPLPTTSSSSSSSTSPPPPPHSSKPSTRLTSLKSIKRTARKRRRPLPFPVIDDPASQDDAAQLAVRGLMELLEDEDSPAQEGGEGMLAGAQAQDIKPDVAMDGPKRTKREESKLDYGFEGLPSLPGEWTYARGYASNAGAPPAEVDPPAPLQVTAASLEFVKSTAMGKGDVDPELGLVDYRRGQRDRGEKRQERRWYLKGLGVV